MSLAFAVALSLLVACEFLRYAQMPPLGPVLRAFLEKFVDERDQHGRFVVTHLELLIGCSAGLWLLPSHIGVVVGQGTKRDAGHEGTRTKARTALICPEQIQTLCGLLYQPGLV
jgi:hypothetical protein